MKVKSKMASQSILSKRSAVKVEDPDLLDADLKDDKEDSEFMNAIQEGEDEEREIELKNEYAAEQEQQAKPAQKPSASINPFGDDEDENERGDASDVDGKWEDDDEGNSEVENL